MTAGEELRADFVFEGGGVKGVALAGAFREFSDRGYRAECVAGTSAGAIAAALVAVGYDGAELEDIVLRQMRFSEFEDATFLDHFGRAGQAVEFLRRRGMHSGSVLAEWLRQHLMAKGKTRFGDLRNPSESDPRRAYRLQVIASDLTGRRMLVLPRDAAMLGIDDPDELEIADAVRMSVSTPIFFEPVLFRHRKTGLHHVVVDGGLLSNYPIWLFDAPADTVPQFPTFGLLLVASGAHAPLTASPGPDAAIRDLASGVEFLKAIVETVGEANDRFYIERSNFARTIAIPTLGVKATQFDITPEQSQELFDAGKAAATAFLATWDFQAYREEFRSARPSATGERGFTGGH